MLTSRSLKASGSLLVVLVMIVMMMMVLMMVVVMVMEVVMMVVVMKMVMMVVVVVMMMIGSEADLQVTKGTRAHRPLIQRSRVQLPTALSMTPVQCSWYLLTWLNTANMWYMESYGNL